MGIADRQYSGQSNFIHVDRDSKKIPFPQEVIQAWRKGALCYMYPINAARLSCRAEEGEVQKQNSYCTRLKHFFFRPSPFLGKVPSLSREGGNKERDCNNGEKKKSRLISNNMPITPLVATQAYTITPWSYMILPHAARGRATHALQPACELRVLLLDLELRARRLGV
jgi:hypothetical protein